MKTQDIKSTKDFIEFPFRQNHNENFFHALRDEGYWKAICGTAFHSEVLYVLPATHNLNNIENYNNLKFVIINNFKIGKKEFAILKAHKNKLENVKFLQILNIKQNDLELLAIFPNVTHLQISYIRKADFSYSGLDYLHHLETLVLRYVSKITDFNFLTPSQKEKIKHLHLTYTARLTKLDGIEDFKNLETLALLASTAESGKKVTLENLNGLEKLSHLHSFEINYFKFAMEELKNKLNHLKNLKQYKVNCDTYENI